MAAVDLERLEADFRTYVDRVVDAIPLVEREGVLTLVVPNPDELVSDFQAERHGEAL